MIPMKNTLHLQKETLCLLTLTQRKFHILEPYQQHVLMSVFAYVYKYIHIHLYIYKCMCVCVCVYDSTGGISGIKWRVALHQEGAFWAKLNAF